MAPTSPRKPQPQQPRQLNHELGACALLCLLSVPGVLLSVFLTLIKFASDYRCDKAMLSACSIGHFFDCNSVLSSGASVVFKLPISAYSTGYYLAILSLAVAVLWRPRLLPVVRPVLLWLAWIGLLIVLGLAGYTAFVLREACSYCFLIYGLTLAIFLTTATMHPQGHRAGLRALVVPWRPRQGGVLLLTGLAFLALVSVQMVLYRRNAANLELDAKCLVQDSGFPQTNLRTRTQAPRLSAHISLFVDLSCHHCRKEFESWHTFVAANPDAYVLEVYHFARTGDCMRTAKRGFSGQADRHYSCLAAKAAECAEKLRPGAGLPMMAALFALQDSGEPSYFTEKSVGAAATSVGIEGIGDDLDHPFYACVQDDRKVTAHIVRHTNFILDRGIVDPPVTYITSYDENGEALPNIARIRGRKQYSPAQVLQEARRNAAQTSNGANDASP